MKRLHLVLAILVVAGLANLARPAQAETFRAPVLLQPIRAGDVILDDQLALREVSASNRGLYLTDAGQIAGMQARRALSAGQPLRLVDIKVPDLVRKGQAVTLVYAQDGLQISTLGRAMQDGAAGDMVRVENPHSRQQLFGAVSAEGLVLISAGGALPPMGR